MPLSPAQLPVRTRAIGMLAASAIGFFGASAQLSAQQKMMAGGPVPPRQVTANSVEEIEAAAQAALVACARIPDIAKQTGCEAGIYYQKDLDLTAFHRQRTDRALKEIAASDAFRACLSFLRDLRQDAEKAGRSPAFDPSAVTRTNACEIARRHGMNPG